MRSTRRCVFNRASCIEHFVTTGCQTAPFLEISGPGVAPCLCASARTKSATHLFDAAGNRSREVETAVTGESAPDRLRPPSNSAHSIGAMNAKAIFEVSSFVPAEVSAEPPVVTALPVGVATLAKVFSGQVIGRSTTIFVSAFDQSSGIGTYVALESFEGSLNGRAGTFNFVHSASTGGTDRSNEYFLIVPASGTGDLAGISGDGGLCIDADGTHRVWFDYELSPVV